MASKGCCFFIFSFVIVCCLHQSYARSASRLTSDDVAIATNPQGKVSTLDFSPGIRSDLIQTEVADDESKPGWMRRQLMRFGTIASSVSNKLGGSAAKVAGMIDKICKVLKTMVPIVAAVCHVGKFQFCYSPDVPTELASAIAGPNPLDLDLQD